MCGIAGILLRDREQHINPEVLKNMTRALAHRGPDGEGFWIEGSIGLGHRRLSIIDIEGGAQPLSNEDQTVWVSYNGEIYNYKELAKELVAKGHRFKTHCDTEVIVHAYEEEGAEAFKHFRGMFSFALWDKTRQTLYLVRDPVGIKPLYYYLDDEKILFASELKSFFYYPRLPLEIDLPAIDIYLTYGCLVSPATIYQKCFKVKPGHYLEVTRDRIEARCFWDISLIPPASFTPSFSEAAKLLSEKIQEVVSSHLVSDVPVGALLSGGVDSSTIVAFMARSAAGPFRTFNIGFADPDYNEEPYAARVAKYFNTLHYSEYLSVQALETLQKNISLFDEPFGDASVIPTFYLSQLARQQVKVVLSGDGGDENFVGYDRYQTDMMAFNVRRWIPSFARKYLYKMGLWGGRFAGNFFERKLTTALKEIGLDEVEAYFHSLSLLKPEEKINLYSGRFLSSLQGSPVFENFRDVYNRCADRDPISRMLYTDMHTLLPDDYLSKVDRTSMFHGLEVRVPLLDTEFLAFTFNLPTSYKLKGAQSKLLLREALKNVLPKEVLKRKKMGFEVPLGSWLRGNLRTLVESKLFRPESCASQIMNMANLKSLWLRFLQKKYENTHLFWALLVLEIWQDTP